MELSGRSQRSANIEVMRIVAMIMIVAHHCILYGVQSSYDAAIAGQVFSSGGLINKAFAAFLLPGGVIGVAIFFIIAGYFGINSNKVAVGKIAIPTFFYSVIGMCLYVLLIHIGGDNYSNKEILKNCIPCLLPIGNEIYWFTTAYFLLMLAKPLLNRIVRSLDKKYFTVLIIFILIEYLLAREVLSPMLSVIEAIFYYFIGAYLRVYKIKLFEKKGCSLTIFIIGWIGYVIFTHIHFVGMDIIGIVIFGSISAIGLFVFFVNLRVKDNKSINYIARLTFDVYLIHEHPLLRSFLWGNVLRYYILFQSTWFPIFAVLSILIIYFLFTALAALIRRLVLDVLINKWELFKGKVLA